MGTCCKSFSQPYFTGHLLNISKRMSAYELLPAIARPESKIFMRCKLIADEELNKWANLLKSLLSDIDQTGQKFWALCSNAPYCMGKTILSNSFWWFYLEG